MTAQRPVNEQLHAALWYASCGWHVFPLLPGTKRPATPGHRADTCDGTDPRCRGGHTGWEARATVDPARIEAAWTANPALGIGIACGPSGLVVLDLDMPKPGQDNATGQGAATGLDNLAALASTANADGSWGDTFTVTTPSGGQHLYYQAGGYGLGNSASKLAPLVDVRARGGYVAAAPTIIAAGSYAVTCATAPKPLPHWITTALTASRRTSAAPRAAADRTDAWVQAAINGETRRVALAPTGQRNHTLFTAAVALGQLVGGGHLPEQVAVAALSIAAQLHITVGAYTDHEATATITSGLRRGQAEPRRRAA